MAVISFVNKASAAAASVTLPTGIAAGDLILIFAYRSATTAPSLAAGYTTPATGGTVSANAQSLRVAYKIADGTESGASSGTFTNASIVIAEVYRNVGSVGTTASATNAASTTTNIPTITLTKTDGTSWVAAFAGSKQATSQSTPSGTTLRATQVGTTLIAIGADTNGGVTSWAAHTSTAGSSVVGCGASVELVAANAAPTVALNTADLLNTSDTTPTLQFTGTDTDGDTITYELQIDSVNTFDSQ
jgi:hypothetical protein